MSGRTAIIAGATGLVGQEILKRLLADPSVPAVHSLGRRAAVFQNPKLTSHVVDFKQLPALPPADELYLAIGTTIKDAGSQDAFRSVDFDANLGVAKAALSAGVKRVGLSSAMGADPRLAAEPGRGMNRSLVGADRLDSTLQESGALLASSFNNLETALQEEKGLRNA